MARIWSSQHIIAAKPDEGGDDDDDEEGVTGDQGTMATESQFAVEHEERDEDWTDEEVEVVVDEDGLPEQEEATVETENFVDTVRAAAAAAAYWPRMACGLTRAAPCRPTARCACSASLRMFRGSCSAGRRGPHPPCLSPSCWPLARP